MAATTSTPLVSFEMKPTSEPTEPATTIMVRGADRSSTIARASINLSFSHRMNIMGKMLFTNIKKLKNRAILIFSIESRRFVSKSAPMPIKKKGIKKPKPNAFIFSSN